MLLQSGVVETRAVGIELCQDALRNVRQKPRVPLLVASFLFQQLLTSGGTESI
jgi:hypothetical protein|eukprot:COSAG01_NODE_3724_length_5761_cov_2.236665_3_plen_53_part_00